MCNLQVLLDKAKPYSEEAINCDEAKKDLTKLVENAENVAKQRGLFRYVNEVYMNQKVHRV